MYLFWDTLFIIHAPRSINALLRKRPYFDKRLRFEPGAIICYIMLYIMIHY